MFKVQLNASKNVQLIKKTCSINKKNDGSCVDLAEDVSRLSLGMLTQHCCVRKECDSANPPPKRVRRRQTQNDDQSGPS